MNWILFAQQNGSGGITLPTSPDDIVHGINQGGANWVLGAVTIAAVVLAVWLGRALLAAKDKAVDVERAHGEKIEGLYQGQLKVAEETRDLLVKINEKVGPQGGKS